MSGWRSIAVRYGGYWDDNSSYIGGGQSTAYVRSDNICISELRGNINYFMMANSLSTTYQLHYLSRSRRGRIIKSLLSSDDDLARACNDDPELEVYATDDAGTSQQEQEDYRPSFETPSTSTYQSPSQHANLDESFRQQFSSLDWWVDTPQHMTPHLALDPVVDENDEDGSDSDYIEEEEEDSGSGEEEEERASTMVSYGTFVEFDAWIRREGGFSKLMSTLMESNEQGVPDGVAVDEADDLGNWLVPIIPQNVSENLFAIPLEAVPDPNELSKGFIFTTKSELKIAV